MHGMAFWSHRRDDDDDETILDIFGLNAALTVTILNF
jgi:hypothetical protein